MKNNYKEYEVGYKKFGKNYQRSYPNEELCRSIGRNFSSISRKKRAKLRILEVGCGSGGNLWMLAHEGFDTYGVDFSPTSIKLAKSSLKKKKLKAKLKVQDMKSIKFPDNYFDVIIDVFSSCHLNVNENKLFLKTVYKKLKVDGYFFSYFPSKKSDQKIYKLKFNFFSKSEYIKKLKSLNFFIRYFEEIYKTYKNGKKKFVFLVTEAQKKT